MNTIDNKINSLQINIHLNCSLKFVILNLFTCSVTLINPFAANASEIVLSPEPHPTTTNVSYEYYCDDQSLSASVSGLNPIEPTAKCCTGGDNPTTGTWQGPTTTYEWGGSASGSGSSSSVSLNEGPVSVSATVKHTYQCSVTGGWSPNQDDSPEATPSYVVRVNDTTDSMPDPPASSVSPVPGDDFNITFATTETIGVINYLHHVRGDATSVKCDQSFIEDEGLREKSTICGMKNELSTSTSKSYSAKISLSIDKVVNHPAAKLLSGSNISYSESSSTNKIVYTFDPVPFIRRNIAVYKEIKKPVSATWKSGSYVETSSHSGNQPYPSYTTSLSGSVGVSGLTASNADSSNALTAKAVQFSCCPNQYDGN